MGNGNQRITAVIAALQKVREHINELDQNDLVNTITYNRWIGMLDGIVEGNWKAMTLDEGDILASEMLMHIDAAIAFLESDIEDEA